MATRRLEGKVALVATVSPDLVGKYHAGKLVGAVAATVGGKGGGKPMSQSAKEARDQSDNKRVVDRRGPGKDDRQQQPANPKGAPQAAGGKQKRVGFKEKPALHFAEPHQAQELGVMLEPENDFFFS